MWEAGARWRESIGESRETSVILSPTKINFKARGERGKKWVWQIVYRKWL